MRLSKNPYFQYCCKGNFDYYAGKLADHYTDLSDKTKGNLNAVKKVHMEISGLIKDAFLAGCLFITRGQGPSER